jgi:hypothetical protein
MYLGIYVVNADDPVCPIPSSTWILPLAQHMENLKMLISQLPVLHVPPPGADVASYPSLLPPVTSSSGATLPFATSCPIGTVVAAAEALIDMGNIYIYIYIYIIY